MNGFKLPLEVPQDLLLIQNLLGFPDSTSRQPSEPTKTVPKIESAEDDCSISSSAGEPDSEDEIEAALVVKNEPDHLGSSHESSSSSSESEDESENEAKLPAQIEDDLDEEDPGPSASTRSYYQTKNEVEGNITIPESEEIGPDEYLEKVGEIMNIMDKVVIVRGLQTEVGKGGSDRALDSETLLVFDDRKVMGYIYETFGPTTQPMYQVKFNSSYPLDPEKVRVSRPVFHVPQRSNFVFMRRLQTIKGSDASNMNDEEPAEHELDFSDDEAEAEHKRSLKKKRAGRSSSVASSRHATPIPAQMRDQELGTDFVAGRNAYDENGPYDADYIVPSRPAPIPYDDPYSDEFNSASTSTAASSNAPSRRSVSNAEGNRGQDRVRDSHRHGEGRERGRGRGRGGGRRGGRGGPNLQSSRQASNTHDSFDTSFSPVAPNAVTQQFLTQSSMGQWAFQPHDFAAYQSAVPYQQPFIQPHINPMFATQFGLSGGGYDMQSQHNFPDPSEDAMGGYTSADTQWDQPHWNEDWSAR